MLERNARPAQKRPARRGRATDDSCLLSRSFPPTPTSRPQVLFSTTQDNPPPKARIRESPPLLPSVPLKGAGVWGARAGSPSSMEASRAGFGRARDEGRGAGGPCLQPSTRPTGLCLPEQQQQLRVNGRSPLSLSRPTDASSALASSLRRRFSRPLARTFRRHARPHLPLSSRPHPFSLPLISLSLARHVCPRRRDVWLPGRDLAAARPHHQHGASPRPLLHACRPGRD